MATLHSGGLTYVGIIAFKQLEGATLNVDDYGLDELTLSFGGPLPLLDEFLLRYPPGTSDAELPWEVGMPQRNPGMSIIGAPNVVEGRAFGIVTYKLVGKAGQTPSEPLVRQSDSWREDTIQGQAVPPAAPTTIVQLIFDYRGLTTTYEYCSNSRPDAPRFANGARTTQLGIEIIRKRGLVKLNNQEFGPIDAALIPIQRMSAFEIQQNGKWWKCTEAWEWALVQQRTFFIGGTVIIV